MSDKNTAEDIVAKYRGIEKHQIAGRNQMMVDAIKEHTTQTLESLKKEIGEIGSWDSDDRFNECKRQVLEILNKHLPDE